MRWHNWAGLVEIALVVLGIALCIFHLFPWAVIAFIAAIALGAWTEDKLKEDRLENNNGAQ